MSEKRSINLTDALRRKAITQWGREAPTKMKDECPKNAYKSGTSETPIPHPMERIIELTKDELNLIGAAPELYEAVRLFVAAGNMSAFSAKANAALAAAHDAAISALAKARGEQ